jgi:hypothetical protein
MLIVGDNQANRVVIAAFCELFSVHRWRPRGGGGDAKLGWGRRPSRLPEPPGGSRGFCRILASSGAT